MILICQSLSIDRCLSISPIFIDLSLYISRCLSRSFSLDLSLSIFRSLSWFSPLISLFRSRSLCLSRSLSWSRSRFSPLIFLALSLLITILISRSWSHSLDHPLSLSRSLSPPLYWSLGISLDLSIDRCLFISRHLSPIYIDRSLCISLPFLSLYLFSSCSPLSRSLSLSTPLFIPPSLFPSRSLSTSLLRSLYPPSFPIFLYLPLSLYLSIWWFIVCTTMFCRLYNQSPQWPMGLFTRSHRIPPATASIQCLETHDNFPWPVPRSCVLHECVCYSGGKCA